MIGRAVHPVVRGAHVPDVPAPERVGRGARGDAETAAAGEVAGLRVLVEVLGADEPALGRGVELTRHVEGERAEGSVGAHELRRQVEELGQRDADRLGAREERVAVEQRGPRGRVDLDHRVHDLEHVRVVGAQALVRRLTLELVAVAGVAGVEVVGALPRCDQAEAAAGDRGVAGRGRRGHLALADGLAALGLRTLELVGADVVGVDGVGAATRLAMLVLGRDRPQVARRADEAQRRGAAGGGWRGRPPPPAWRPARTHLPQREPSGIRVVASIPPPSRTRPGHERGVRSYARPDLGVSGLST